MLFQFIGLVVRKIVVNTTVVSRLDYCNGFYLARPKKSMQKLQSVLNSAAKGLMGLPRRFHISPVFHALHWLPIQQRIWFKTGCFIHRIFYGSRSKYIWDNISIYCPRRCLRSADSMAVVILTFKKVRRGEEHRYWNKLPITQRKNMLLESFHLVVFSSLSQYVNVSVLAV